MLANWYSNGQVCSNGTRVFVHKSLHDAFVSCLIDRTARLKIGNHLNPESEIGPMATSSHLQKVEKYIQQGQMEGASLVYGGTRTLGDEGNYILPAIFTNCK